MQGVYIAFYFFLFFPPLFSSRASILTFLQEGTEKIGLFIPPATRISLTTTKQQQGVEVEAESRRQKAESMGNEYHITYTYHTLA